MFNKIFIIAGMLLLTACSSVQRHDVSNVHNDDEMTTFVAQLKTNKPYHSSVTTNKQLAKIYQEWEGTRYRLGGLSKNGIDCSGFTQTAFADAFGIALPRSTNEQRYVGKSIQKSELKHGDLVFFRANRHVGIYLGNNKFMHASTTSGVMISSLNEAYWSRTYTQSRRVL